MRTVDKQQWCWLLSSTFMISGCVESPVCWQNRVGCRIVLILPWSHIVVTVQLPFWSRSGGDAGFTTTCSSEYTTTHWCCQNGSEEGLLDWITTYNVVQGTCMQGLSPWLSKWCFCFSCQLKEMQTGLKALPKKLAEKLKKKPFFAFFLLEVARLLTNLMKIFYLLLLVFGIVAPRYSKPGAFCWLQAAGLGSYWWVRYNGYGSCSTEWTCSWWCHLCLGLSELAAASYTEDNYGVVQKVNWAESDRLCITIIVTVSRWIETGLLIVL